MEPDKLKKKNSGIWIGFFERTTTRIKELISNIEQMEKKDKTAETHPSSAGVFQREEHMKKALAGLSLSLENCTPPRPPIYSTIPEGRHSGGNFPSPILSRNAFSAKVGASLL